jgi:hypothetical protein
MAAWRGIRFENEDDSCSSRRRVEPERAKGGEEEGRLLEAIASAPVGHDLLLYAFEIEPDRAAEQNVDILEGNGVHMLARSGFVWPEYPIRVR